MLRGRRYGTSPASKWVRPPGRCSATEAEFLTYMSGMGFRVQQDRGWLDKELVNDRDGQWDRARRLGVIPVLSRLLGRYAS